MKLSKNYQAQYLTQELAVLGSIPGPATFESPSADSGKAELCQLLEKVCALSRLVQISFRLSDYPEISVRLFVIVYDRLNMDEDVFGCWLLMVMFTEKTAFRHTQDN